MPFEANVAFKVELNKRFDTSDTMTAFCDLFDYFSFKLSFNLVPLIHFYPVKFRHYQMSTEFWEVHLVQKKSIQIRVA